MYQRLIYFALISLAVNVLAGCAGPWPYPPPQTSAVRPWAWAPPPSARPPHKPAPSRTVNVSAPEAGGERLAMAEPGPATLTPGLTTTLPPLSPAAPSPPDAPSNGSSLSQARELIGLDQPAVTRLLGATTEQFEQPPALVWRYRNATCQLDLFFYLDLSSNRMRTLHYTVNEGGEDASARQVCVKSLRVAGSH